MPTDPTTIARLLPCPFCGGPAVYRLKSYLYTCANIDCECEGPVGDEALDGEDRQPGMSARERWNTRAASPQPAPDRASPSAPEITDNCAGAVVDEAAIRTCIGFLASSIRCGTSWCDDHQKAVDKAIAALGRAGNGEAPRG